VTFTGQGLNTNDQNEVDFTITATPSTGSPITISSVAPIPASAVNNITGVFTVSAGGPVSLAGGVTYTLSGTATIEDKTTGFIQSTVPIASFTNPNNQITCAQQARMGQNSIDSNFNGTQINSGSFIWFNATFKASGIPSSGTTTIFFTNSTITLNGTSYPVPNAEVIYSPSATCASITFNAGTNTWITTVPTNGNVDDIFFDGLALPVPTGGLPGGGITPVWNGTFSTSTPGVSVQWKWGAAVYTHFDTNYNNLNVKATHQNWCAGNNGDS
jgi:hypothetical protein